MKFSPRAKSLAKDLALAQKANNDRYTMDISEFVAEGVQPFLNKLKRVDVFAQQNNLTRKQVFKLMEANSIPCTLVCGVPFVIDLGTAMFEQPAHPITQEAIRKFNEFSKLAQHGNAGKLPSKGRKRPSKSNVPKDYKDERFLND